MLTPGIKVNIAGKDYLSHVSGFEVESSLGEIGSCRLDISDPTMTLSNAFNRGESVIISWGYNQEYSSVFDGLITRVTPNNRMIIVTALDQSVRLNGIIISKTYSEESAAEILKDALGSSGLELDIADSDYNYSVFPVMNESAQSLLNKISRDVKTYLNENYLYSVKGSKLIWRTWPESTSPVMDFKTGENIIDWKRGQKLTTLIVPVVCGDVVKVDGENYLAQSLTYRWNNGGRTIMKVEAL